MEGGFYIMAFNGIKYIKNVTKSFGYAMVDVVGEMNPVVHSFSEANGDLGKELYQTVKDYKGTAKKIKKSVMESDVYEFAKNYKRNLFEDLKTGKFYNKERIDSIAEKASGWDDESLNAEFSDMFSDDDDDISFDDWDKDSLRSDMFMAEHIDDVGAKISDANAEVTIRSAEYMANVQKETAKALYAQNNKLFGQALQGMAAINANVGQLVGMPELMQVHTNNASTFFEKTSGQLDQITTLLDTLVKNTTPSDEEAQRRQDDNPDLSFRDIFTSKGMPNLKKYFQYAKKNIANNTGELAMLGDLFGNGVSMLQTLAASPLEDVMKAGIKQMIPTVLKSSMDQFNDTLQGFFGSAITKLNRVDSYDNSVLGFIQKIFGIQPDLKTDFDTARYEKGKVNWDGVSRKALVEVIPGQLAKIASALTGEDPLIFNPDTGRMESIGRINDRANGRLQDAANSAGYNVRRQINQIMSNGKIRFGSKAEQDKWEDDLDAFFMNIFQNGGLTDKDIKGYGLSNLGVDGFNADLLKRILEIMSKNKKGKSTLLDLNRRVLSGIDQYTAQMNDMEAKGSVDNALYNGMFENFIERYNSDEARSARNATGIKDIISARERSAFSAQTDEYGHNIFYYLQGIFQRQDAIYENSSYMVENWGSGGGGKGRGKSKGSTGKGIRASLKDIIKNKDILSLEDQIKEREKRNEEWYRDSLNREKKDNPDILEGITSKNLDEMELNNDVAEYRDRYDREHNEDNKTFVDKMLEEKTLSGKFGVLVNGSKSFFRKPLEGIAKMFDSASDSMYNLIYGEHPSDELKDMGFIGVVKQNIQGTFDKMNGWIDEHVLNPLKEKFGIENRDDFFRKLFGVFDKDYDAFKDKMKEGVFGTKDKDGRRSGGILGDYVQDVKDNTKGAFNWMKDGFKDVGGRFFGSGSGEGALDHWSKGDKVDLGHYATGGTVQKTGIAAVSKGELIIPSEMNPFYHGPTDKAQQIRDENQAVRNFFGSYAKGGRVKDQEEFDYVIEDVRNYINNAGVEISDDELKKYLAQIMIDKKLMDYTDKNGNPVSKLNERVKYLVGKAKGYIKKKELAHRRKQLTGQKVQIVDYNEETGEYMTNDGYIGNAKNLKKGRHITKNKQTGIYEMREKPESFLGDMVLNLAKAAKTVHHSFVDGNNSAKGDDQNTAFDEVIDDVTGNFKSYAGAMTVGGGIGAAVSALTGMVGGPLVGAAVGSAVGLTMKSDKVQNWLFGEAGEDGRQGGVFSKETSKFITEKVPTMAKFGMVGGAAGTIMGHPMIGTLIGSAVGLAQKSETFGNIMFNGTDKDGNKHKGLLNMTQEQFNEKVKTKLPRVAAGALAGALTTPLPFGFLPNIMLGSAIGFASDTEKFKTKMFGAIGKDGERHGGIVGALGMEFHSLGDFIKDHTSDVKDWLENDIMKPLTDSVQPLAKQIGLFTNALTHPIKWLLSGTKTNSWLERTLQGQGLAGKVYKAGKSVASNVADASIGLAKGTIGLVPQMIGAAGARARYKQITRGNADYMTAQERLDYRDEHNNVEGFKDDWRDVGNTFVSGWNNIRTKGKRLSGVGNVLSGLAKTGISFGKIGTHLINGAGRGIDEEVNSFRDADKWIANASLDQKKQMRTLLINTVDAQKGKNERIKNLQRDLDANIRSNTFSLLNPRDREKFISKVKKDGNSLDDLREFLTGCKTIKGQKLTDQQIDEIMGTIEEGVTELRRLQGLKEDKDLEQEKDAAIKKLNGLKESDGSKYGWLAKAMNGDALHKRNAEKLLSMLNYDIDMDDQYNEQQSDEDKAADQAAQNALKREEEHNEAMDLGKIIANLLAAAAGMEQPYDDVKKFTKNDKVKDGSSEDINADEDTKSTDNAERNPLSKEAEKKLNPETLKEDTDHPEQQQEVPAAAFGGLIKKAGKAVLHAGEFVVKKGSSAFNKTKEFFGNGEDDETAETTEEEQSSPSKPAGFKGSKVITNAQQMSPVAGMFNDDSTAAHVGNYLPGQIVWISDRRYKYDGESQELIPDNDTAKQYEANKKKALANANGGSNATTKPDQQEVKNASDDTKTLSSLFQSMGLGGGIGKLLGGLKNLSWIPSLAGPIALLSFLSGKLDPMLGNLVDTITNKLGFSDSDAANFSLHGTDGEEGYSDRVKERIGKNALSLINVKGGSNLVKSIAGGFSKAGDKLLGKKRLRGKIGGAISKVAGSGFGLLGRGLGAAEDVFEYGANHANRYIMQQAKDGKLGKLAQKFAGNFKTSNWLTDAEKSLKLEALNKDKWGYMVAKDGGFVSNLINSKNGKSIYNAATGKLKLNKSLLKDGKGGIKSVLNALKDQKATNKLVAGVKEAAESGSDKAKKEAADKLKEWLVKLVEKGKIDKSFLENADEFTSELMKLGENAGKSAAKNGSKKTFVGTLKSMGPVGWATTLVMAVADFTSGYQDANSILGVSDATTSEKVIAGLIKSLKGVIEGIIACVPGIGTALSIGLSLIPEKSLVTLFVKVFKNVLSPVKKLDEKRKEMNKKVKAYNKKTGKNYDTEQYLKTVNNDKTMFEKAGSKIKAGFHNFGAFFTGGKKIDTKKNQDSGYDEDGNLIDGYLNKSTKRWKGYYAKAINKGVISSDYAEALYMNECLHDSSLKLDDERKADYEKRIAEFKSANPNKEIPSISADLKGLINNGSVSGTGGFLGIGAQKKGSVDYGNGKTSESFVGKFATGGLIQKSGLAALSKGELRTTPAKFLSDLLGGSKSEKTDVKDYKDLTDLGSFVKDIQSLDPSKTEWKDYWAKLDGSIKLKGVLGTLKKTLYRIAATMFMPTFAMGKALDSVNSSLGSQMNINSSNSSSSSDSSSASSSDSSSSSSGGKKKGFLSKVVGSVKNLFGKLFGGNSGSYGGASAITDGSFISQLDSKDQYGDSSYAEEGCAPATAAMLINQVNGNSMTMEEAGKYAVNRGYKVKGDGTKEGFFKDIFNSKGIASENVGDQNAVLKNLKAGKPTIILGQDPSNKSKKTSPFGKNPHYVLATGVDKNGNIIVNDPEAKRGGKRYKPNILAKMKSAISTKAAGGHSGLRKLYGGTGDVASQVWYFLRQNGFSEQAAAGVMGNLKQETNMNPSCEVSGVTCGIACWDNQNGKNPLKEAASKAGVDWKDLGFQLNYLLQGLPYAFNAYTGKGKHYYSTGEWCWWPTKMTFEEYKVLTSINDAAEIFERVYERASKPLIEKRKKYANEYYTQFTGKEGEPVSYTGSSDSGDSSSNSTGDSINSFIGNAFKDAMNNTYGSSLLSSLTSAGLFSGFGDEDTNVSDSSDTGSSTTATVTTADGASVSASTTIGQEVATDSANYVGNKYVYGGNDLNNGIDCSGFVQQLYKKHGYDIAARRAVDQFNDSTHGTTIKGGTYNDLKPGDAMYFSNNGKASGIHHTGIYVGNGHMIHAQSTNTGIVDTDLSKSSYYQGQYIGAKRFGSGSGMATAEPNVSGILSSTFKSSKKSTTNIARSQTKQIGSGVANVIGTLAKGSNGSMSLDNLVDSIEKIAKLLQSIADNTEPIAQICKLITGMNDDNKEAKKKQEEASKTTRKSMSVGSRSKESYQSSNSSDILQLLTAFSQV